MTLPYYELHRFSIANVGKEKNGDACIYKELGESNVLIAAIADGVSQQPCDWLASKTTCEKLVAYFAEKSDIKSLSERLHYSIHKMNELILAEVGKCRKMASTLSVVVWEFDKDHFYYANIGDSRIYSIVENRLLQLTKDDTMMVKERVFTRNGSHTVNKAILNKVIGQEDIQFEIEKRSIKKGEVLLLLTDGFYEARKATFNQNILNIACSTDFKTSFDNIIKSFEIFRGDDFTIIAIKRN